MQSELYCRRKSFTGSQRHNGNLERQVGRFRIARCHVLAPDISPAIEEVMKVHVSDQR